MNLAKPQIDVESTVIEFLTFMAISNIAISVNLAIFLVISWLKSTTTKYSIKFSLRKTYWSMVNHMIIQEILPKRCQRGSNQTEQQQKSGDLI